MTGPIPLSTRALTGTHGYRCPKCEQNVSIGIPYEGHRCLPSVEWFEGKWDALDRRLELIEEMLRPSVPASPAEAMMALGYLVFVPNFYEEKVVLQEVS